MARPADDHIAWAKVQVPRHRYSVAESDVDAPDLHAMGLPDRGGLPRAGLALQAELERVLGGMWGTPGGRVLLTAGASEANAVAFGALLEPGDEVLVESPGYQPHREAPRLFGVGVRRFERPLASEGSPLAAVVEAALGPATRVVVVTHPHNPSGVALTPADARALQELAERQRLWILCDEIFRDAMGEPRATYATLGPRWVVTSSLTKVYGLGGLRLGWIAGSEEVLARCAAVHHALSASLALPSIALALDLVPHLDILRDRSLRMLAANRERWDDLLRRGTPFAKLPPPRGTTAWALWPEVGQGDAFASFASRHFDLAVTPGRFFGDPRGVRVGLGGEPARFAAALDAFDRALAAFPAGEAVRENA